MSFKKLAQRVLYDRCKNTLLRLLAPFLKTAHILKTNKEMLKGSKIRTLLKKTRKIAKCLSKLLTDN